jgi:uncharacterized membrane protein YjjP (DUF1212 family)
MSNSEQEVPQRESLGPTVVELIVCAGFAILLALPGGLQDYATAGLAGLLGRIVGSFLVVLALLFVAKLIWRLVSSLVRRARGARA